ncbi:MAG TPA: metal-sulfur cluster assembly factor [Gemmatimonadales bacterium]|nr:metal-sulfur cluster assembly factor [Gemmatimonadales bacterium]
MVTERQVRETLSGVQDPEYPISIVDLGMVYGVRVMGGVVEVDMTFTSIGCPAMDMLCDDVRQAILALPGVEDVRVAVVWSPPWTKDRITERGRRILEVCGVVG